jgi:alcohol dehydrogenase (cytochrome c)
MKRRVCRSLVATATLIASLPAAAAGPAQTPFTYSPVTQERLLAPEPRNWLLIRRTYDGWGYSPLEQITSANVENLKPAWTFATSVNGGHQSPPIVNDGVMFITTPGSQVIALDARLGDELWRYVRKLPEDSDPLHLTNRGVGLWGDKVYVATQDAHVVALDARTGAVVWDREVADYKQGYYMTIAPLVVKGKVMVGPSGGEYGIRGFVAALDAETGDEVWRRYTIPAPGEPGSESWPGDSWQRGGVPVWLTGHYDPQLDLAYFGTGNGGPWMGDRRDGDNLYATSVLAIDVETGELRGHHQYHWNDSWDWDEVSPPLLIDVERGGRTIKGLVSPARNGYLWLLERSASGIKFVDAKPYVYQDVFTSIDPVSGRPSYDLERKPASGKRVRFCPSWWGGKTWPPAAYNPGTKLLYIPANENLCGELEGLDDVPFVGGLLYMGVENDLIVREGADHIGELQAWNLATGERTWKHDFASQIWGPVLTTGGNLVFMGGTNDRYFHAFDAATGALLWQYRTSSGITAIPVSYEIDGKQYVAVQSGWGVDAERGQKSLDSIRGETTIVPAGGVLWVFALP